MSVSICRPLFLFLILVLPAGTAQAAVGDIYIVDDTTVKHYDGTTGALLGDLGSLTVPGEGWSGGSYMGDPTFGPDGNLYMQVGDQIREFDMMTHAASVFIDLGSSIAFAGFAIKSVPEPSPLVTLFIGLSLLAYQRRRLWSAPIWVTVAEK